MLPASHGKHAFQMVDLPRDVRLNTVGPDPGTCRDVFIPFDTYHRHIMAGQESIELAHKQLELDAPRSLLVVQGVSYTGGALPCIPDDLVRFCTQTVLAPAIEMMMPGSLVAELRPPTRMKVHVNGKRVRVIKRLRAIVNGYQYATVVEILAGEGPLVRVTYRFGRRRASDLCDGSVAHRDG